MPLITSSGAFGLNVLMEHVVCFVKCTALLRTCPPCALSCVEHETRWSIRGLRCKYKRDLGPKWPARAASRAQGSQSSVALLSYYKPLMGKHQKPICLCMVDITLHVLLLHTPTWPYVAAKQRQGHPRPGTCQHRSRVGPCALMPYDRQGTTR